MNKIFFSIFPYFLFPNFYYLFVFKFFSFFYYRNKPITDKEFQMLYECEEERFVFKSCLRDLISLRRSHKHTSWKTADISNLYLS